MLLKHNCAIFEILIAGYTVIYRYVPALCQTVCTSCDKLWTLDLMLTLPEALTGRQAGRGFSTDSPQPKYYRGGSTVQYYIPKRPLCIECLMLINSSARSECYLQLRVKFVIFMDTDKHLEYRNLCSLITNQVIKNKKLWNII